MSDQSKSQTPDIRTPFAIRDGAPSGRHYYFYIGWEAHALGAAYDCRATSDWCCGWREREQMIRRAVQQEIANG